MTRTNAWHAGLAAAAVLLLCSVGHAGAGGPPSVLGVPCSEISTQHIYMQTNVRAYLVVKGCAAPGTKPDNGPESVASAAPLVPAVQVGGTDRDVISPQDTSLPHDTQAGSMVAAKGNTIVVDYNDSRDAPSDYSGASISTDGGNSWTRIDPFATGHGDNFGDPLLVYNRRFARFVGGVLVAGCGGQGIGAWTSGNGQSWAPGPCVHSGTLDDRPSIAVDNDPASPFYGSTYVSWNDFALGSGALVFSRSTDGGVTWSAEQVISNTSTFIRNTPLAVQPVNGQVDLVGVDEGGGGFHFRTNYFFRSQDGGVGWSSPIPMGASFPAAGDTVDGYYVGFHNIWRAMGSGNPVPGGPTTIVYPYYQAGGDLGDVYAVRSIDGGATWSAPIAISTAPHEQWSSQAVSNGHGELAIWYYSRENTTDGNNYEVFLSKSHDGGATWTGERRLSDVLIDEPVQNDPNILPFFAGDYNVTTSDVNGSGPSNRLLITWTDGRNNVTWRGNYDFKATTGTLGSGGTDVGNHCDDCSTALALPFPVTFYGTSYTTVNVSSNGVIGFGAANGAVTNPCLPSSDGVPKIAPFWDDLTTLSAGFGWFSTTTGTAPYRVFTLREDAQLFNSTTPEVHFEVRLHENATKFEIVYGTLGSDGSSATAGAESGVRAKQIECNSPGVLTSGLEEKAVYNATEPNGNPVHSEDVEFDQVPLSAKITVKKALSPATDSGRFDLLVGSTVVAPAAGNGGSGTATVAPGTFTVKETAASGSLTNYATTIACTKNGLADLSGTGTSLVVTVAADDVEVCTITNKRMVTITLRKSLTPTSDSGRFNLIAGSKTLASGVGNGGHGSSTFAPASYTLKETASSGTTLSNYTSSIACTRNGGSGPSTNGTSLVVSVAPADVLDCTFKNVRKAKITVTKALSPTSDPGRFNLLVGSTMVKSSAGNGGSGSTLVDPGTYTVSESAASGTSLSNYTSSIACTKNGSPHKSGPGTSLSVSVAAGDAEACTITNVRK